ncbi:Zn-ribbon domain-containing OB-fold protein [Bacillus dakarensis]|uniref:Zn-ribbon domain-containing OB-fold protein n=1 Tax=Robertmurraya dakarensis TaxID=1926278 RepID=UPI000A078175|nr:OB-fold domain-containing protein [Bacillus dakarensis]
MADIQLYQCSNCKKEYVQKKWICSTCKGTEFHLRNIPGEGTVFSHTTIHISSKEFAELTPYTIALVQLPNGLRITGRISGRVEINDSVTCINNEENQYLFAKKS